MYLLFHFIPLEDNCDVTRCNQKVVDLSLHDTIVLDFFINRNNTKWDFVTIIAYRLSFKPQQGSIEIQKHSLSIAQY